MLNPLWAGLVASQQHQAQIFKQCAQWFDQDKLHIELSKTFPLDTAVDAHHLLEFGSMQGKIALLV